MWYPKMGSHSKPFECPAEPPVSVSGVPLEILDDVAVEPAPQGSAGSSNHQMVLDQN